jgi:hypothetical protein
MNDNWLAPHHLPLAAGSLHTHSTRSVKNVLCLIWSSPLAVMSCLCHSGRTVKQLIELKHVLMPYLSGTEKFRRAGYFL